MTLMTTTLLLPPLCLMVWLLAYGPPIHRGATETAARADLSVLDAATDQSRSGADKSS